MIRVEVPGSSFMLCLGPGPPSLLHLTRANAEKPYAGDTIRIKGKHWLPTKKIFIYSTYLQVESRLAVTSHLLSAENVRSVISAIC